ncbi:MAG: hypothetical protein IPI23_00925 [Bacteroidetes bacterium]|nr:hypothetical protein [Bacteroidota bacterium]
MGKLTLLSSESVTWLTENYSGLTISSNLDEINGQIKLIAAYNSNSGRFLNISEWPNKYNWWCCVKG